MKILDLFFNIIYLSEKRYYFQSSQGYHSHMVGYSGPKIEIRRDYVQAAEQFRVQRTHIDFSNTYQQLGFRQKLYYQFRVVSLCMKGSLTTCESKTNVLKFETRKSIKQITLVTLVHGINHI